MIEEFIYQNSIDKNALQYSGGFVYEEKYGFIISSQQKGAEDTFSISQPIYDCDHNKLGYLGIGCFRGLDYTRNPHKENVPCIFWRIENPTKYCKHGVKVYTYWQNYNETEKINED